MLEDWDSHFEDSDRARRAAAEALSKLEPGEHAAALVGVLKDSDRAVRRAAVEALGALEPAELAKHAAALGIVVSFGSSCDTRMHMSHVERFSYWLASIDFRINVGLLAQA